MAETIKLTGADGFEFAAYHEPAFTPRKGGVIVIQEIFGIDSHVRADVERWAKMGSRPLRRHCTTAASPVSPPATTRTA